MSVPNDAARCPGPGNETEGWHVMEHTKEPWRVERSGGHPVIAADSHIGPMAQIFSRLDLPGTYREVADLKSANARRIVACVNTCAGVPTEALERSKSLEDFMKTMKEIERQRDELLKVFNAVINELDKRKSSNGVDAPGHWHSIPGIWDSDNGALAGKPCGWCAIWKKAKEISQASVKGGA